MVIVYITIKSTVESEKSGLNYARHECCWKFCSKEKEIELISHWINDVLKNWI